MNVKNLINGRVIYYEHCKSNMLRRVSVGITSLLLKVILKILGASSQNFVVDLKPKASVEINFH